MKLVFSKSIFFWPWVWIQFHEIRKCVWLWRGIFLEKDQCMDQLEMFINYSTKIYSFSLLDYENTDLGKQSDHYQQLVLNSTEKEIQKKTL